VNGRYLDRAGSGYRVLLRVEGPPLIRSVLVSVHFKDLTTCLLIAALSWSRTKCSRNQAFPPLPVVVDVHRSGRSTRGATAGQGSESRWQNKTTREYRDACEYKGARSRGRIHT